MLNRELQEFREQVCVGCRFGDAEAITKHEPCCRFTGFPGVDVQKLKCASKRK